MENGRTALLALLLAFAPAMVVAGEKTIETTPKEFGNTEVKTDKLRLNNFTLSEERGFMVPERWREVRIELSGKNNSSRTVYVQLQVVGLNASGQVLWAAIANPPMDTISGGKLEQLRGGALVKPGTLRKTAKIVLHIRGDW